MTELEPGESKDVMIVCKVCRESIRAGAKKCINCDSFQDWRRFLNMSGTVLALLVALVTVSSAALPKLKELLTLSYSEVLVLERGFKGNQLAFQLMNNGTKQASFISARLRGTFNKETQEVDLEELGPGFPILPDSPRPLLVHVPAAEVDAFTKWPTTIQDSTIIVVVRIQEFGGEVVNHQFKLSPRHQKRFRKATQENYLQYLSAAGRRQSPNSTIKQTR